MPEDQKSQAPEKLPQPQYNRVRHVIGVMSGKGGVGKSTVSVLLASEISRQGLSVGILDADITGPSIPRLLGVTERPAEIGIGLLPPENVAGIKVISLNLLLEHEDDPVIWRGPLIAGAVRQFWTDVVWGDLDYMVVDLPPGTGDAPLTVLQSLPVEGLVIVSSPQDLAVMVVRKAIRMAQKMNVPVLGLVENMTFVRCPRCGEEIHVFGRSQAEGVCREAGIPYLGSLPLDPALAELGDQGKLHTYEAPFLAGIPGQVEGGKAGC